MTDTDAPTDPAARAPGSSMSGNGYRFLDVPSAEPADQTIPLDEAFRRMDTIRPRKVEWLWRHRIPTARLSILAGVQGFGKSHVGMAIAASLSRAGRKVLWISAEDDDEDTTQPRLAAAGANMANIYSMRPDHVLTLPDDADQIELWIREAEADFVVLDPLLAFLGLKTDAYRDHHVRRVLTPIRSLAVNTGAAIVGIMHLKKGDESQAVNSVGGSVAWTAAPRSVLMVTRDLSGTGEGRVLWHPKCNIGPEQPPLEFRIVGAGDESRVDFGEENVALRITDHIRPNKSTRDDTSERAEAKAFLLSQIADGDVPADDVKRKATAANITPSALRRAREVLTDEGKLRAFMHGPPGTPWTYGPPNDDSEAVDF